VLVAGGAAAALTGHLPRAANYKSEMRSAALSAALKDERVTFDEYNAGLHRFETCAANAGHPLQDVTFIEATQLYRFITDGSPAEEDCYQAEWYALDLVWQTDPNRPGFNPVTLLDMRQARDGDQKAIDKVTKYQKLYDSQCQDIERTLGTLP
jgi:hypothetical protein